MKSALLVVWHHRMVWWPVVVLLGILVSTFLLLPRSQAPFVYAFF